jgi:hypothetical protein
MPAITDHRPHSDSAHTDHHGWYDGPAVGMSTARFTTDDRETDHRYPLHRMIPIRERSTDDLREGMRIR